MTRICVIGSGIAGLTAAKYLVERGYRVDIFEQSETIGGRLQSIEIDGYTFDIGATLLTPHFIDFLKEKLNVSIKTVPISWDVIASQTRKPLRIDRNLTAIRDIKSIEDRMIIVPQLIRYSINHFRHSDKMEELTVRDYFGQLNLDHNLKTHLCAGSINAGLPSDIASSEIYKLMEFAHHFRYPVGGTGTIPHAIAHAIVEQGGQFHTNSKVNSIHTTDKTIQVRLDDEEVYDFDYVLSTIGPEKTISLFQKATKQVSSRINEISSKLDDTISTLATTQLYYLYSGDIGNYKQRVSLLNYYPQDGVDQLDKFTHSVLEGEDPEPFGFYMNFPAYTDASLVNNGKYPISFWLVSTANPNEEEISRMKRYIVKEVENHILPGFSEHAEFIGHNVPVDFQMYYDDPGYTSRIASTVDFPTFESEVSDKLYIAGANVRVRLSSSVIQASESGYEVAKLIHEKI